jgi:predicted dithiol-disulfide oxidoreductase (DUF899 family)
MGDIIVLTIIGVIVTLIVYGMIKNYREGVSAACKSCSVVKDKSDNQIPYWVKQYKERKIDE